MTMSAVPPPTAAASGEHLHELEWSAEEEIQLFFALEGLKPVGVNKHFYMACIAERLSRSLQRDVPAAAIWAHLRTMYNLDALDALEPLPFPNEQRDFSLPDTEFSALLSKKRAESESGSADGGDEKQRDRRATGEGPSGYGAGGAATSCPPSIIAVATDNTTNTSKDKSSTLLKAGSSQQQTPQQHYQHPPKEQLLDKKIIAKLTDLPKRTPKRTRGSMSLESNSPSTTPPPVQANKRRRI